MKAGSGIKFSQTDNDTQEFTIEANQNFDVGDIYALPVPSGKTGTKLKDTPTSYGPGKLLIGSLNGLDWILPQTLFPSSTSTETYIHRYNQGSSGVWDWQHLTFVKSNSSGEQDLRVAADGNFNVSEYYGHMYSPQFQCQWLTANIGSFWGSINDIPVRVSNGWEWKSPPWEASDFSELDTNQRAVKSKNKSTNNNLLKDDHYISFQRLLLEEDD